MALINLSAVGILTVAITICLYLLDSRYEPFRKLPYMTRQIVMGCVFGALAILGTESGVSFAGGTLSIRDAAPICGSLVIGGPAGITAALIGAAERCISVFWGAESTTMIAGCAGILFSGLFSAAVRKSLFEDKRASAVYAVAVGAVCAVFHCTFMFFTNAEDYVYVLKVVESSALYMVIFTSLTTGAASLAVNHIENCLHEKENRSSRGIASIMGRALLIMVVIAFAVMNGFVLIYQDSIAGQNARTTLENALNGVAADVEYAEKHAEDIDYALDIATANRRIGDNGIIVVMNSSLEIVADSTTEMDSSLYDISEESIEKNMDKIGAAGEGELRSWQTSSGMESFCMVKRTDGYTIIGFYPKDEAQVVKKSSVFLTAFSLVLILAAVFVQIYYLIKKIVIRNIREINGKLEKITAGNLETVVEVEGSSEFHSLSEDINTMVGALRLYIREAETRMDKDLELAKNIQYSALNREFPESNRFELYANMMPAKEVGGDFYDFYKIDEDRVAFIIADVSGKGVPASLFMMRAKTLIKGLMDAGSDVATALTNANEELCKNNDAEIFVTSWLGVLDTETFKLTFANAGHNRPVLIRNHGRAEFLKCRSGFVLAGMEGIKYRAEEVQLGKGDSIFLYTDGVTEAVNKDNELYSDGRLLDELNEAQDMRPNYMCSYIKKSIDSFAGEAPQFDDITMLAVRIKDEEDLEREKVVVPGPDSIDEVESYFEHRWDKLGLSNLVAMKTNIVIDEVYSNIVENSRATMAKISMTGDGGVITLKFIDNGLESNPVDGMALSKKMAVSMEYERAGGRNIVTVKLNADEPDRERGKGEQ